MTLKDIDWMWERLTTEDKHLYEIPADYRYQEVWVCSSIPTPYSDRYTCWHYLSGMSDGISFTKDELDGIFNWKAAR